MDETMALTAKELQDALLTIEEMTPKEQEEFFPLLHDAPHRSYMTNLERLVWILHNYTCADIFNGAKGHRDKEREKVLEESRTMLKQVVGVVGTYAAQSLLKEVVEEIEKMGCVPQT